MSLSHQHLSVMPATRLSISRYDWLLFVVAFVVSRVVLYAMGYFGAVHYNLDAGFAEPLTVAQALKDDIPSIFCQFDCGWFQSIADIGYDTYPHGLSTGHAANWAFLPGYPLTGYWIGNLLGMGTLWGFYLLTNVTFFFSMPLFFLCLRQLGQDIETSRFGVWLLAFSPFSVYFIAPYTEAPFLLLTLVLFLFAYRHRWLWVAVAGLLMTTIRNQGVMVVFPVLILALQAYGWRELLRFGDRSLRVLLTLWVIPLALFGYMLYLYHLTGDAFAFKNIQLAWGRIFNNPFQLWLDGFTSGDRKLYLSVVISIGWIMNLYLLWQQRFAEAVFMALCTILPLLTSTNAYPRYLFSIYPTLLVMALFVRNKPMLRPLILALSALLSCYFTIAWVNSKFFVV